MIGICSFLMEAWQIHNTECIAYLHPMTIYYIDIDLKTIYALCFIPVWITFSVLFRGYLNYIIVLCHVRKRIFAM